MRPNQRRCPPPGNERKPQHRQVRGMMPLACPFPIILCYLAYTYWYLAASSLVKRPTRIEYDTSYCFIA